jgi:hypothetical protein
MKGNADDRYRTGCLGILLPLALVAYALRHIVWHYRHKRHQWRPVSDESIEWRGVGVLAIALFVHALGFVPYKRWPLIRWGLVAGSVILFFYSLWQSVMTR